MRDEFSYYPKISKQQFFARGFAERKILMIIDLINLSKQKKQYNYVEEASMLHEPVLNIPQPLVKPTAPSNYSLHVFNAS